MKGNKHLSPDHREVPKMKKQTVTGNRKNFCNAAENFPKE